MWLSATVHVCACAITRFHFLDVTIESPNWSKAFCLYSMSLHVNTKNGIAVNFGNAALPAAKRTSCSSGTLLLNCCLGLRVMPLSDSRVVCYPAGWRNTQTNTVCREALSLKGVNGLVSIAIFPLSFIFSTKALKAKVEIGLSGKCNLYAQMLFKMDQNDNHLYCPLPFFLLQLRLSSSISCCHAFGINSKGINNLS